MASIYESELFTRLPDRSMHPGGLRLTDRAVRLAGLAAGQRCADLGCGAGATCAFLSDKYRLDVIGFDPSETLINTARQAYPGLLFECRDCRTLPIENCSLNAVLMECTLSVIGSAPEVLKECARVLKPSGKLILSDITLKLTTSNDGLFTAGQLEALLRDAGFSVELSEDHTPALRTYAAELAASGGGDTAQLLCGCLQGQRLCDLGYHLLVAAKK
jgi:ubiquinone/menaquinone biosynthesis C-methylase UbiE